MDSRARSLGPWRSWSLVVGGAVGSAVFLMPALIAPYGGVGAFFVAVTLGNLARRITCSGGPYACARAGLGDFAGFLIAWAYWISLWTSCAYLAKLLPVVAASPTPAMAAGVALTWLVVAMNIAGVRESGIVGLVTTLLKLVPLMAIGTIGLFFVDTRNLPPWNPGSDDALYVFASAFGLIFWNYVGIESATVPAEDVVDSPKTISRALIRGTLTITILYLVVAFATMGMLPASVLATSSSPLADVGSRIAGTWGGIVVSVGALVSIIGTLNITMLCAGQTSMAAARDHLFPAFFDSMTARKTPGISYAW